MADIACAHIAPTDYSPAGAAALARQPPAHLQPVSAAAPAAALPAAAPAGNPPLPHQGQAQLLLLPPPAPAPLPPPPPHTPAIQEAPGRGTS